MMMPGMMMPQYAMPGMMPQYMMFDEDAFSDREKKLLVAIVALVAFIGYTYYKLHYKTLAEFANKFRNQIDDIDFKKIQAGAKFGVDKYVKFKVSKTERAIWVGSMIGDSIRGTAENATSIADLPEIIPDPARNINHVLTKTELGDYIYIPEQTPAPAE